MAKIYLLECNARAIDAKDKLHKSPYLCYCRDMREMKNLLSKLRETMPLPLKNQGKIETEHFLYLHPLTHTHINPMELFYSQEV